MAMYAANATHHDQGSPLGAVAPVNLGQFLLRLPALRISCAWQRSVQEIAGILG